MIKSFIMLMILLFVLLHLIACSDSSGTKRILEQQGYTNVETTGYSFFGCDKSDHVRTRFIAASPNGKTIEGTVCNGFLFKNYTIRFD